MKSQLEGFSGVVVIVVAVYLPRLFRCLRKAEEEPTQEASSQETDEDEDEDEEEAKSKLDLGFPCCPASVQVRTF